MPDKKTKGEIVSERFNKNAPALLKLAGFLIVVVVIAYVATNRILP